MGFFSSPPRVFAAAALLRAVLFVYGLVQDELSPMKYTDIDYFVFTDAARFVSQGESPYARDTYRYTPLLAWLLYPTAWGGWWFSFGKVLFAVGDLVAGWLIYLILRSGESMRRERALKFASIWLLNPMVAQISTRGSSEGLLGVIVVALLWAMVEMRIVLAGLLLGVAVHFKIYPFIYAPAFVWWLDAERLGRSNATSSTEQGIQGAVKGFLNFERFLLALTSFSTFASLNGIMYAIYGGPFFQHSFLHHVTRLDHRHNFSPYNTLLHLSSSPGGQTALSFESLAFLPQLLLSTVAIPLVLAKRDLPSTLMAQTFAFVTFNKVCTSQYFLWYMVFLPFYLPSSSLLRNSAKGVAAATLWVLGQVAWLQQGYQLEFIGQPTFVPGLWAAGLAFFLVNIWILGVVVEDVARMKKPVVGSGVTRVRKVE